MRIGSLKENLMLFFAADTAYIKGKKLIIDKGDGFCG